MTNPIGCLILHGFGGHYGEIAPLDEFLKANSIPTLCPTLSGHEGGYSNLKQSNAHLWLNEVKIAYDQLQQSVDQVVVIGFSMGSLLSLLLSHENKLAGLVLLNAPIYQWNIKRILSNVLLDIQNRNMVHSIFYMKSLVKFPVQALYAFKKLVWTAKKHLPQVEAPVLICQGLLDDTVQSRSAEYLKEHLVQAKTAVIYYKHSDHLICCGVDQELLQQDILQWLYQLEGRHT